MDYVLISHQVADFDQWKAIFDQAADIRRAAGEREYQVLVDDTDPTMVVHFSSWTSLESARTFFESPELVDIRRRAGVRAPDFRYLHQVDAGTL